MAADRLSRPARRAPDLRRRAPVHGRRLERRVLPRDVRPRAWPRLRGEHRAAGALYARAGHRQSPVGRHAGLPRHARLERRLPVGPQHAHSLPEPARHRCGPSGPERGKLRPLANPRVGAGAHARLSNGVINGVTEYDAKPAFANVVYFNSNTTQVSVGGIARGMVRVARRSPRSTASRNATRGATAR